MAKKTIKRKKSTVKKRKRKRSNKLNYKNEIKPEQILLHNRHIFLSGVIDTEQAHKITTQLIALDVYRRKTPIVLYINSRGGCVYDGLSIIDCMAGLSSPVFTVINGEAASMAAIISIFGDKRYMCKNSVWMAHDMCGGGYDYATKMKYRFENMERLQSKLFKMLKKQTKLSETQLTKARNAELWLYSEECLKYGIIDEILN